MIINHNVAALNTHRQLGAASNAQAKNMEKLSSGLRINRAGDDAAGLAISEKMRGQIRGLDQAQRNAQDGISLIQTAEGALNETHSILQRMRELAVQAANDTNTDDDRAELQKEIEQLKDEINRISSDTEFNTKKLLNGSVGYDVSVTGTLVSNVSVANTKNIEDSYTMALENGATAGIELDTNTTGLADTNIDLTKSKGLELGNYTLEVKLVDATGKKYDFVLYDENGKEVASAKNTAYDTGGIGIITLTNTESTKELAIKEGATNFKEGKVTFNLNLTIAAIGDLEITSTNGTKAYSSAAGEKIKDSEFEAGNFKFTGLTIDSFKAADEATITVKDNALSMHIGANEGQTMKIDINKIDTDTLGVKDINVTKKDTAETAITAINDAITKVSAERSKLGAFQNRLEHTINNLGTSSENLTSAESRIRDVDMAKEMMEQTKNSILTQAAQAMLAQANQRQQGVLQLLQ